MHIRTPMTALAVAAAVTAAMMSVAAFAASANPPANAAAPPGTAAKASGNYGVKLGGFFTEEQRQAAKRAIAQKYAKAKTCPPGMERADKKASCAAPVKGHYWAVGQMLQSSVTTYPVPPDMAASLPPPPAGYKYLLAGEDILLVAASGLNLVVDMIQDVMG